jgi:hypothetical protein
VQHLDHPVGIPGQQPLLREPQDRDDEGPADGQGNETRMYAGRAATTASAQSENTSTNPTKMCTGAGA